MSIKYSFILLLSLSVSACTSQSPATEATAAAEAVGAAQVYERVSNADFKAKMGSPNTVILDVRTPAETARGTIEGALQIDFRAPDFEAQIAALDRDKTYLVYCHSGGRSARACTMMQEMGFNQLYELKTGYSGWE